jgi:hypothetical protein
MCRVLANRPGLGVECPGQITACGVVVDIGLKEQAGRLLSAGFHQAFYALPSLQSTPSNGRSRDLKTRSAIIYYRSSFAFRMWDFNFGYLGAQTSIVRLV